MPKTPQPGFAGAEALARGNHFLMVPPPEAFDLIPALPPMQELLITSLPIRHPIPPPPMQLNRLILAHLMAAIAPYASFLLDFRNGMYPYGTPGTGLLARPAGHAL